MRGVLGLDLAPGLTGWAYGDGPNTPVADAWEFKSYGDDLGLLAVELDDHLDELCRIFDPAWICYEGPILRSWDAVLTLRQIYGLGYGVERYARTHGLVYREAPVQKVKSTMTGERWADKDDVVKAALALGIDLPVKGRKDAADGVGAMLYGMAEYDPPTWAHFDSILNASRGALL